MYRFEHPYFLALFLLWAALIWFGRRRRFRPSLTVSALPGPEGRRRSVWVRIDRLIPALKYLALALIITALAGPQQGATQTSIVSEGIDIVLAVDASESMAALDFSEENERINRLEAVKGVVRDFVAGRRGDRIGLVVFGSEAYTQAPLTRDYQALEMALDGVEIGAAGPRTAIGDALGISLKRLEDVPAESKVVILLTDGRSNAGQLTPEEAADVAAKRGVKVYTIGVGGRGAAPFLVDAPFGGKRVAYRTVDIDEKTLEDVARATGGLYFRATDTRGLEKIYQTIDQMEKTEVEVEISAQYNHLYPYFLLPAFVLLGLWVVLINTRLLRVP